MTNCNQKVSAFRCCLCPISCENLPSLQLFRCHNCKLISYCGHKHQKEHWSIHKSFCKAIRSIMEEWQISYVLDINGKIAQLTTPQAQEAKFTIQAMMVVKLCRDLTEHERELIWFPRICNTCNNYEGTLNVCQKCFSVCYCCEEHRLEDMPEHSIICPQLHLCYNFCLEELPECDVKYIPCKPLVESVSFPRDLFELYKASTAFLEKDYTYDYAHLNLPTTSPDYQKFANVCNISNVATILHILNRIRDYKILASSTLTIHIVGANSEILLFTRYECWILFYWLPTIFHIKLIFIGPELILDDDFTEISYESIEKKTVQVIYKKMKYEEFMRTDNKTNNVIEPDLIVSFNCGFSEFENSCNPWRAAISAMLTFKNIPIAFTSYTKTEAITDLNVLRRVADAENCDIEVICDGNLNLFRDYRPFRNFIGFKTDVIYYYNGYMSHLIVLKFDILLDACIQLGREMVEIFWDPDEQKSGQSKARTTKIRMTENTDNQ